MRLALVVVLALVQFWNVPSVRALYANTKDIAYSTPLSPPPPYFHLHPFQQPYPNHYHHLQIPYRIYTSRTMGMLTVSTGQARHRGFAYQALEFQLAPSHWHFFQPTDATYWFRLRSNLYRIRGAMRYGGKVLRSLLYRQPKSKIGSSGVVGGGLLHSSSAKDLYRLLDGGVRRRKSRIYNYVLRMDGVWTVSETGGTPFVMRNYLSKHMVLGNTEPYVLAAGDLFIEFHHATRSGARRPRLVLTNNTGTYATPLENTHKMARLLQYAFPGLEVVVLGYDSAELKERRKRLQTSRERWDPAKVQEILNGI